LGRSPLAMTRPYALRTRRRDAPASIILRPSGLSPTSWCTSSTPSCGTTSLVRHVATVLRDVAGHEAIRDSVVRPLEGLKVAIHYGCHLLKPSRPMQVDDPNDPHVLEELVKALGATPVRHRNCSLCCGKACQSEDLPARMMHDLLAAVSDEEADLLCLVCPTCFGQFDFGQLKVARQFNEDFHTPPVYFPQLLALAQGVPYDRLGFDRQRLKPEVLRRFEGSLGRSTQTSPRPGTSE
jgi:heterodisulfide reductase subunit B